MKAVGPTPSDVIDAAVLPALKDAPRWVVMGNWGHGNDWMREQFVRPIGEAPECYPRIVVSGSVDNLSHEYRTRLIPHE